MLVLSRTINQSLLLGSQITVMDAGLKATDGQAARTVREAMDAGVPFHRIEAAMDLGENRL